MATTFRAPRQRGLRGPGLTTEQQNLIASIPDWLTGGLVSAGELADEAKGLNLALPVPVTGTTVLTDDDGQRIGLTIASGQSGGTASLIGYPLYDPAKIAQLAGKTVRLVARYFATANFRTLKPLNPIEPVDVGRFVGNTAGTLIFEGQTGTELTRIAEYDVVGDEDYIGISAQVAAGAPTTGAAMTLRLESLTYLVVGDSPATVDAAIAAKAAERFGVSLLAEGQSPTGELAGGATWLRDPTTNYINGIAVANGVNGNGSNLAWYWLPAPEDFPLLRGARTRFTVLLKTSTNNARPPRINIKGLVRADGGDFLGEYRALSVRQSDDHRAYVVEGTIDAGGEQISVGFEDVADAAASGAQWFTVDDILLEIISTADGSMTGAQATMQLQRNILARNPRRQIGQEVTVAATGGDFTSLYAAFAGSVAHQTTTLKASLLYTTSTLPTRPFAPTFENAIVRGAGPTRPVVALRQPASTALSDIEANSAADLYFSGEFSNLHIIGRNVRYASHDDDGNLNRDQHTVYTDMLFEHEGNDDAIAYQTGIGGAPNSVWRNCAGAGIGGNSGGSKTYTRCGFLGWNFDGLIGHGAAFADRPFKLNLTDCWSDPRATTAGDHRNGFFWATAAGDMRDEISMDGFTTAAPIMLGCSPWAETDPAKIPANKMNISFGGSGVSHVPFLIEDDGSRALRITSAKTGSTSSVAIAGTAAPKLLGSAAQISTVTGAAGLSASMTGWFDVGDHLVGSASNVDVTRLGKRIATGDVLTVTVDGGTPINISLTANQSNTTILAAINAALGSAAVAELVNLNERYRPRFADQEVYVCNAGTTTILRKRAVAWADAGHPNARVMTPFDLPSAFAGVAYETIKPGAWGRVKSAGAVRVSMDIERSDGGAFVAGDGFCIADTEGRFAIGDTGIVLQAINSQDIALPSTALALSGLEIESAERLSLIDGDERDDWSLLDVDVHMRRRFGAKNDEISTPSVGVRHDATAGAVSLLGPNGDPVFSASTDGSKISSERVGLRSSADGSSVEVLGPDGYSAIKALTAPDSVWAYAITDDVHNRVLYGIRKDGTQYPPIVVPAVPARFAPLPVALNLGALRNINLARAAFDQGQPFKMRIGQIGDSFTASGFRWLQNVVHGDGGLLGHFGDGGAGWVSFVTGNVRGTVGNYRLTGPGQDSTADWLVKRRTAGHNGPDISSITALQAGGTIWLDTPADAVPMSSMKLIYNAAAPCSIKYRWDDVGGGGTYTTVALATTGGPTALDLSSSIPTDIASRRFRLESVSGGTELNGLMLDSSNSGVNFSALGVNGSTTADWINNTSATWRQSIALLGIKSWFISLGTNDQAVAVTPTAWMANTDAIITRLRTVDPACDICIMVVPENFDPARITTPISGYEMALRDYCDTHPMVAGLIMQSAVGVAGGDYSATGAFPLWDIDLVHPEPPTGGAAMARFYLRNLYGI